MGRTDDRDSPTKIIDTVLELLESDGYEAVQLREVARRARVSLTTVYKLYPTRDDLILAAVERWMAANAYAPLPEPTADECLRDGLLRLLRSVFEPWERHPRMLKAFYLARSSVRGARRLDKQGFDAILPAAGVLLADLDSDYVADVGLVLTNMTYALIGRFADDSLEITEVLPALERIVYRLTANNEHLAAPPHRRPGSPQTLVLRPSFVSPYDPDSGTAGGAATL
ncbi:TetR family transcriptional regulator [Nocardia sp. BMG51109]|uniref:TetR family transcriptional regulator n=1 Tax=Nocardia sp. BMG51109 TaxID=1056816 RepID=UPI0004AC9971|nr:TetR family transcriptional regulator [Nocardia sp. BMG51109]